MVEVLLVILIILVIFVLYRILQKDKQQPEDINNDAEVVLNNRLHELEKSLITSLNSNNRLNDLEKSLISELNSNRDKLDEKLESRLSKSQHQNSQSWSEITTRLQTIDNAQQKLDTLTTDIVSLQSILSDKKSRGTFGEVQLNQIFHAVYGDGQKQIFEEQYTMSNGKIVDFLLKAPQPLGKLPIDAKFPLNSYENMYDDDLSKQEQNDAKKQFKLDIKKHIKDISEKYVTNEAGYADYAVMFIPAEAIFAEIHAYHPDLIEDAQRSKV